MAIVSSVDIITSGVTPDTDQIQAMLPWLRDLSRDQSLDKKLDGYVLTTNRLFELYPPAKAFQKIASGLLAIEVGQHRIEWLLWFRPEVVQIISWAGDPRKIIQSYDQTGQVRLSPRGSFALWQEEHAGSSEPWLDEEAKIARELRLTIVEAALGQALRNSEATARSILGNASQGILTVNRKGLIVDVNPMVEKLFGYDRIELVGNTVEVLLPDALRSRHISHRADYVSRPYTREMGQGMDLLALRKDGTQFPV
jgi:PAS domain S-box-containing protein